MSTLYPCPFLIDFIEIIETIKNIKTANYVYIISSICRGVIHYVPMIHSLFSAIRNVTNYVPTKKYRQ